MKELDFLLEKYMDNTYEQATAEEKQAFVTFLELDDGILIDYLLRGISPENSTFKSIVDTIVTP